MNQLSQEEVKSRADDLKEWMLDTENNAIRLTLETDDFMSAISRVNQIAEIAEEEGHHPNLHIDNYNELTITLTTHDEGGLTEKDFNLAEKINNIL